MRKRFWLPLCACLLAVVLRVGVEWGSEVRDAVRRSRAARAIDAAEPAHTLARLRSETAAPLAPPSTPAAASGERESEAATRGAPDAAKAVAERPEAVRVRQPTSEQASVAPARAEVDAAAERDVGAEVQETAGRRVHDGDLGRATLKSGHLRDRTRESLGGGDLGDLGGDLNPGRPLGEATLETGHLKDRTREGLGGTDLRELSSVDLGKRTLKSGHLRDLSWGEDDNGDLADRSGR